MINHTTNRAKDPVGCEKMAFHEYIWKERVYLCQLAISSLLSLTWLKIEWLCDTGGNTPAVLTADRHIYTNTHVKRYTLDVCVRMVETNERDMNRGRDWGTETGLESHTRQLSHTHTRVHTRTTAAVWPASSIFHQIRETDRSLFGLLIVRPPFLVGQSQQERIESNSWPLKSATHTPCPDSLPCPFFTAFVEGDLKN